MNGERIINFNSSKIIGDRKRSSSVQHQLPNKKSNQIYRKLIKNVTHLLVVNKTGIRWLIARLICAYIHMQTVRTKVTLVDGCLMRIMSISFRLTPSQFASVKKSDHFHIVIMIPYFRNIYVLLSH